MASRRELIEKSRFQGDNRPQTRNRHRVPELTAAEHLYRINLAEPDSPIITINYESKCSNPFSGNKPPSPEINLKGRSKPPALNATASTFNFPVGSSSDIVIAGPLSLKRTLSQTFFRRRTPSPPPPYTEEFQQPLLSPTAQPTPSAVAKIPATSRQRTLSASSWMKNVISRQSSRGSLRQQYVKIPPSPEEIREAEQLRKEKNRIALTEWERINKEILAAGF